MVSPTQVELKAFVLHITSVDRRCRTTDDQRRGGVPNQQVLGLFDEVVDTEGQTSTQQDTVETEVQLLRRFPLQVIVTHR